MRRAFQRGQLACCLVAVSLAACGGGSSNEDAAPPQEQRSLTVSWVAPEYSADGSALTDLAGYRVLVGTTSGQYVQTHTVDGGDTSSLTLTGLQPATYYIVVKAFDTSNNESEPTAEVVGIVQ